MDCQLLRVTYSLFTCLCLPLGLTLPVSAGPWFSAPLCSHGLSPRSLRLGTCRSEGTGAGFQVQAWLALLFLGCGVSKTAIVLPQGRAVLTPAAAPGRKLWAKCVRLVLPGPVSCLPGQSQGLLKRKLEVALAGFCSSCLSYFLTRLPAQSTQAPLQVFSSSPSALSLFSLCRNCEVPCRS